MPRYVILEHDHPFLHWDLMLEYEGVLRCWRLAAPPENDRDIPAEPIFDHRLHYLDYEGPISGGRGEVKRWDRGTYQMEDENEERWTFRLAGERLSGLASLERLPDGSWVFQWQRSVSEEREVHGGSGCPEEESQDDRPQQPAT